MVREKMKHNNGRFFLTTKTRFGPTYYRESGTFDVGTAHEESYLYWTSIRSTPMAFPPSRAPAPWPGSCGRTRASALRL